MTAPLLLTLPGNHACAAALAGAAGAERGVLHVRRFPDGEQYVRLDSDVAGRSVALVCTLRDPDAQFLPLCFAAAAARDLGAARVGLVAPYLAYMRQDARFQPGEAITSAAFATLLSTTVDWLVTVEPHLHRHHALGDLYRVPATAVSAAPAIATWVRREHPDALIVGPDEESAAWAGPVAAAAGLPLVVLEKVRRGDRDVDITAPALAAWRDRTPVVVDDIISTAGTMATVVRRLRAAGLRAPICIGVHAVFAEGAAEALAEAGAARVVTCDTVAHATNAIAATALMAPAVAALARVATPDAVG